MINTPLFPSAGDSFLSEIKRRKSRNGKAVEDVEEAPHSGITREHMQRFFDVLQDNDEHEQPHAFAKVVEAWRADNAAGGLPVYGHRPLPDIFANAVAEAVRTAPGSAGNEIAKHITANLEPGARSSVLQQLAEAFNTQTSDIVHPAMESNPGSQGAGVGIGIAGREDLHKEGHNRSIDALVESLLKSKVENLPAPTIGYGFKSWSQVSDDESVPPATEEGHFQTLEFDPRDAPEAKDVVFVDESGKPVPSANPLPNGAIPPPRPSFNKVLPIDSAVPTKGHPPNYASGEYDPNAIGLRVGIDKHGRYYWKRHDGIDFYARHGEPVRVAAEGVVVAVEHGAKGYGSLVAVRHPDGTMTMYAHLDPRSIRVRPGEFLRLGSVLGGAGVSGNAARPQVHFEVWRQPYFLRGGRLDYRQGHGNLVDPYEWYDHPMPGMLPRPKPTYP